MRDYQQCRESQKEWNSHSGQNELRIWKTELYFIFTISLLCPWTSHHPSSLLLPPSHSLPWLREKREREEERWKRRKRRKEKKRSKIVRCKTIFEMITNEFCCDAQIEVSVSCDPLNCHSFCKDIGVQIFPKSIAGEGSEPNLSWYSFFFLHWIMHLSKWLLWLTEIA